MHALLKTPFSFASPPMMSCTALTGAASGPSSPGLRPASAPRPHGPWRAPGPRSRSRYAMCRPARLWLHESAPGCQMPGSTCAISTWQTRLGCKPSPGPCVARCISWSTTPGSWPCRRSNTRQKTGNAVRHQLLGALQPGVRAACRTCCGRVRADRLAEFQRQPAFTGALQLLRVHIHALHPLCCLRAVEDRLQLVCGGCHSELVPRLHLRQRAESWCDRYLSAAAHRRTADTTRAAQVNRTGAATTVLLASSALLDGVGGLYFEDCNEAPVVYERSTDFRGVAPYALNPANAERLWNLADHLVNQAGRRPHT